MNNNTQYLQQLQQQRYQQQQPSTPGGTIYNNYNNYNNNTNVYSPSALELAGVMDDNLLGSSDAFMYGRWSQGDTVYRRQQQQGKPFKKGLSCCHRKQN